MCGILPSPAECSCFPNMAVYAMFVGVFTRAEERAGGLDYPHYRNSFLDRGLHQDYYQDESQADANDRELNTRSTVRH